MFEFLKFGINVSLRISASWVIACASKLFFFVLVLHVVLVFSFFLLKKKQKKKKYNNKFCLGHKTRSIIGKD